MSAINDGGPAFPRTGYELNDGSWVDPQKGMTLRDWFAGQALAGLLATDPNLTWADIAEDAYRSADAMIAARKGGSND